MQTNELLLNKYELFYLSVNKERFCIKTGKKLKPIPFNEVEELITIHGFKRAKLVINNLKQSIALEWILTDSEGLKELAFKQPVEYLIYALSALLKKPNTDSTLETLKDFEDKIIANVFLKTLPFEQIANIAEYTRRILASNRPIALHEMLQNTTIASVCASQESLLNFQLTLEGCLKQIALGYYDDKIVDARNRQKKSLFLKQKQLTALTELEKEIGMELNNFEIIIDRDTELQKLVKSTKRSKQSIKDTNTNLKAFHKQQDKKTISLNEFKLDSFAGIKFGGKK